MKSKTVRNIAIAVLILGFIAGLATGVYTGLYNFRSSSIFESSAALPVWVIAGVIAFVLFMWASVLENQEKQIAQSERLRTELQRTENAPRESSGGYAAYCAKCGRGLAPDDEFCFKCGAQAKTDD